MANEIHAENLDRIESDYDNLQAAGEIAFNYMHDVSDKRLCFPALTAVVNQVIEQITDENMGLMMQERTGMIPMEQVGEALHEVIGTKLLEVYFIGVEMGKKNINVWTHVILDAAVEEAEQALEREQGGRWPKA